MLLDSAPVKGIFVLPFASLKSAFPGLKNPLTEFREYPERTHWTIAQGGWEEVADFALEWAEKHSSIGTAKPA